MKLVYTSLTRVSNLGILSDRVNSRRVAVKNCRLRFDSESSGQPPALIDPLAIVAMHLEHRPVAAPDYPVGSEGFDHVQGVRRDRFIFAGLFVLVPEPGQLARNVRVFRPSSVALLRRVDLFRGLSFL